MTFPTPFPVKYQAYTGLLLDDLNNEIPCWEDPAEVRVISWNLKTTQELIKNTSRQVVTGRLLFPPEMTVNVRDRFTLPARRDQMGGVFEVTEVRDVSHGFHGWNPGGVAELRKTPETKQQVLSHDC